MRPQGRSIALDDVCDIIAETINQSAPAMKEIGNEITHIDHPAAKSIGAAVKLSARFALSLLPLLQDDGILVLDKNGSRSINDQRLVMRALKAVRQRAHDRRTD